MDSSIGVILSVILAIFTRFECLIMVNRTAGLVFTLICLSAASFAQTFTSSQSGPWNLATTWGGAGVPDAANSTSIVVNHAVTVPTGFTVTVDQVTVTGSIIVSSGGILDIANGTGNDLTLTGTGSLDVTGTVSKQDLAVIIGTTVANTTFRSGSRYQHLNTASEGLPPTATWNANSTVEIAGWTSGKTIGSTAWSQSFGHFVYNCPAQAAFISFNGLLTNIQGDLIIQNSNGIPVQLIGPAQTRTITIGRDLTVLNGSRLYILTSGTGTVNIGRDFIFNSTNASGSYICSAGNATLNIARDFSMNASGGVLFAGAGSPSTGIATLNIGRDYSVLAGRYREEGSSSQSVLNFNNSRNHIFTNTGLIQGTVDYLVAANDTLTVTSVSGLDGVDGTAVTSDFVLNGFLFLHATDALGALRNGAQGSVRTPVATRTYNSGSTIIYGATTGAQFIGDGHPTAPGVNVTVNNPSGVSFASNVNTVTITGTLTLVSGNLNVASTTTAKTLVLSGNINPGTNFLAFTGANSDLTVNGSGVTANLSFLSSAQTVRNFILNRVTGATLISAMTIGTNGTLTLSSGDLVFNAQSLTINGLAVETGGRFSSNSSSSMIIGGSGAFGTLPIFAAPSGNTLGVLTLNRASGSVTINSTLTIGTTLNLTTGTLTNTSGLTMGNGSTIVRASTGSLAANRPTNALGDSYSVTYSGSSTTTGLELPISTDVDDLLNLTINGGPITLNQSIIVNGVVNLNASTLGVGSNTITMEGTTWNDNAGNVTWGTNPVIFNGTSTSVAGSSTPTFSNVQVNNASGVVFTTASLISGNLVVNTGGSITFPATTLTASSNVTINTGATVNPNSGTLILNGTALQNISVNGASLHNITVSKSNGSDVALTSALGIDGILDIQSANSDVASSGFLTLLSTSDGPTGNGSIAALLNNATVSGNVNFQRFQSAEGPVNRYFSTPVSGARVVDLQDDFPITGPFTGSSYPCTGCLNNGFSLKYYNEPFPGAFNKGYTGYPFANSSNTAPLDVGRGYLAYMWQGASQITWDLTGPINSGSIALPVTVTVSSPPDPNADGWNLVGNPYPASIDWDTPAGWTKVNIAPTIYVWDDVASVFRFWNGTTGDLNSGVIGAGQSFWVYGTGSSSLTVHEQAKTSTTGTYFRRREAAFPTLQISISQADRKDNSFLVITGEDSDIDMNARKLDGEDLGISITDTKGSKWVMYAAPNISNDAAYQLSVLSVAGKSYTIAVEDLGGFELDDWKLYDNLKDHYVDLTRTKSYAFTGDASDISRFYLVKGDVEAGEDVSSAISIFPNPASEKVSVTWTGDQEASLHIVNGLGTQMTAPYTLTPQETVEFDIRGWKSGMYVVQIAGQGKFLTRKIIKK